MLKFVYLQPNFIIFFDTQNFQRKNFNGCGCILMTCECIRIYKQSKGKFQDDFI